MVTSTIGFVKDDGKETRPVVGRCRRWTLSRDFQIFSAIFFLKMLRDAEKTLEEVDVSMALTEKQ